MAPAIRAGAAEDRAAILGLTAAAFPEEDLRPLVGRLLDEVPALSILIAAEARPVGYALLTPAGLSEGAEDAALLGPVAVAPDAQGAGVGRALVEGAREAARAAGAHVILVLGAPAFYGRFGFGAERGVAPPYPLPEAWDGAWQSVWFGPTIDGATLAVPGPWRDPALWAP